MSIDKVKTFWKTVVREREDFWSSLFKKVSTTTTQDYLWLFHDFDSFYFLVFSMRTMTIVRI